mmetsp:Transcript_9080/g.27299  ORF Transcript_9080/g.27299 Transcript_9080/m.27299 type:complete len:170 (+) Transcript_9080:101-610(+)
MASTKVMGSYGPGMGLHQAGVQKRKEERLQCLHSGCGKTFNRPYNFKVHMRLHTGQQPYVCPKKYCDKRFKWRSGLTNHLKQHAVQVEEETEIHDISSPLTRADSSSTIEHSIGAHSDSVRDDDEEAESFGVEIRETALQEMDESSSEFLARVYIVKDTVLLRVPVTRV